MPTRPSFCGLFALLTLATLTACGSEPAPAAPDAPDPGVDASAPPSADSGTPALVCAAPLADCNALAADGCEVDTSSDPLHCGKCDRACPGQANAAPSCTAGVCGAVCNLGYVACAAGCCPISGVIVAGYQSTCAIDPAGAAKCWGYRGLHDGFVSTVTDIRTTPSPITSLTDPTRALAASMHGCAVTTAGKALCWGRGTRGELGNGGLTSVRSAGPVRGLASGVAQITVGTDHACALTDQGAMLCWGNKLTGQFGAGSPAGEHTAPSPVPTLGSDVAGIASGAYHACAWTTAGLLKCWGSNSRGQLGVTGVSGSATVLDVPVLDPVALASAGPHHTCALSKKGAVSCWGSGLAVGNGALGSTVPFAVPGLGPALAVSAGDAHTCVVTAAGAVKCWGTNANGQLGNGLPDDSATPVDVALGGPAIAVAAGRDHTCAMLVGGRVKCWGNNWFGALGNGERSAQNGAQPTPVDVTSFP